MTSLRGSYAVIAAFALVALAASLLTPWALADDTSSSIAAPSSTDVATAVETVSDDQSGVASSNIIDSQNIAFQGTLDDASGTPVPDGLYNVDFKIYDAAATGTIQWEETFVGANRIPVTGGSFSAVLGQTEPINLDFSDNTYYLAVTVGGTGSPPQWDAEMTPRKEIVTVEKLLAMASADNKTVLQEFIQTLNGGTNVVLIVDSASMANLLASLEQEAAAPPTGTVLQDDAGNNNAGFFTALAEAFMSAFEDIQSTLTALTADVTASLGMLTHISGEVDQIYQVVVVDQFSRQAPADLPATSVAEQQSGAAVVSAGATSMSIMTDAIQEGSNVFITFPGGNDNQSSSDDNWNISERVDGQYFTITFDAPMPSDTVIDWWVLNDSPADEATTVSTTTSTGAQQEAVPVIAPTSVSSVSTGTVSSTPDSADATSTDLIVPTDGQVNASTAGADDPDAADDVASSSVSSSAGQ